MSDARVIVFDEPTSSLSEKDAQAGRATDGDPGTSWTSDTYNSAAFGGLKDGVGLRLVGPARGDR